MTVNVTRDAINVREKLAELDKPTGIAGEAMLRAETPQEQQALIGVGRRNFIINGLAQVSQRGDYTSATSMTVNNYYIDRWKAYSSGGTNTIQQVTSSQPSSLAGSKSIKILSSSGGTIALGASQIIEDYQFFVGKELTVSGWIKSTNPNARFLVSDNAAWNAVGDAHSGSGDWEFITGTITLSASATGLTLSPRISTSSAGAVSVSANDYIEFTGVQLELGKVATPFEHRSYGEELALCQRYFWQITGSASDQTTFGNGYSEDTNSAQVTLFFPVEMRDVPSTTIGTGVGEASVEIIGYGVAASASLAAILDPSKLSVRGRFNADSGTPFTGGHAIVGRLTASSSAYIWVDAEL